MRRENVNLSPKGKFILVLGCIAGILILALAMGWEMYRTSGFQTVQGTIVSVRKVVDLGERSDHDMSVVKYITCSYKVDGEEYSCRYRTFFTFGKKVGDAKTIHYNVSDPEDVRNYFLLESAFCIIVFLVMFLLLAQIAFSRDK